MKEVRVAYTDGEVLKIIDVLEVELQTHAVMCSMKSGKKNIISLNNIYIISIKEVDE